VTIESDLMALADVLKVPAGNPAQRMEWISLDLSTRRRWLLVFDNVEAEPALRGWWPDAGGCGTVLVTSRLSVWHRHVDRLVRVGPLAAQDAIRFLYEHAPGVDRAGVADVVTELEALPLALEQAAAYVAECRTTWSVYRGLLERQWLEVLQMGAPADHEA